MVSSHSSTVSVCADCLGLLVYPSGNATALLNAFLTPLLDALLDDLLDDMDALPPIPWINVAGRLSLAIVLSGLIGVDREFSQKAAGLRTNMLVALGAALFILVSIQSGLAESDTTVVARTMQGVITGVGFVGAGSILREDRVRGLTSATAVWISAGVGIAAGLGLWQLSLLGTGLALIILRLVKLAEKSL